MLPLLDHEVLALAQLQTAVTFTQLEEAPDVLPTTADCSAAGTVHVPFQSQFKQVFAIFKALGSAKPSDHFTVDLAAKTVRNANPSGSALSFN